MSARLVVMMTPADRRAREGRARAGLTPSEFCRRAVGHYEAQADEQMPEALLTEFEANDCVMSDKLRAANDRLDATFAAIDARRATREAELVALRDEYAAG